MKSDMQEAVWRKHEVGYGQWKSKGVAMEGAAMEEALTWADSPIKSSQLEIKMLLRVLQQGKMCNWAR